MDVNKSTRTAIFIVLLLCTVLLGYLIVSEVSNIRRVKREIVKYENLIMDKRSTITELRKSKNSYEYLEENLQILRTMIPDSMYEDSIIIELQNHAKASNISLVSIDFMDRNINEKFVEMPLNITLHATHKNFLNLLNNIVYGDRLFRIDSIQLRKDDDGLIINMKAKAFCTTD